MSKHVVKQGEHLSRIALEHGLSDYRVIWDHPDNAELKRKRGNPNVLSPGDDLFIPDRVQRTEDGATEARHRFRCHTRNLVLRLVLKNLDDSPVAGADCELVVEGRSFRLTTDADGRVEHSIPATAEQAWLLFRSGNVPFKDMPIRIGHLDPVEEPPGLRGRLNNLGYDAGPVDGKDEQQLRSALAEFQCDAYSKPAQATGEADPGTLAKLKDKHGC